MVLFGVYWESPNFALEIETSLVTIVETEVGCSQVELNIAYPSDRDICKVDQMLKVVVWEVLVFLEGNFHGLWFVD